MLSDRPSHRRTRSRPGGRTAGARTSGTPASGSSTLAGSGPIARHHPHLFHCLFLLLAISLSAAGCGSDPAAPRDPTEDLTVRHETEHGIYYHAPGDAVDLEAQEEYYVWLFERMGLEPSQPLVYFKYRNRAHMGEVTGNSDTNGWAEIGTYRFHTIWDIDNHESVHALVSSEWNAAPALMNEGMAVAHQALPHLGITDPVWSGTPIDTLAARAIRKGSLPPVEELLKSTDFRRYETSFIYPVAGSFVKWVLDRHGYGAAESFFRMSTLDDSGERLRANFRSAFGGEIEDAWDAWRESLR